MKAFSKRNKPWNDLFTILSVAVFMAILCALSVSKCFGDDVKIPQTSRAINSIISYDRGEVAYIPNEENKTAELFVGGERGEALKVIDSATLRAVVREEMTDYSVAISADVTCPSNGWYECVSSHTGMPASAWIRIYPTNNKTIEGVTFAQASRNLAFRGEAMIGAQPVTGWTQNTNAVGYVEFLFVGAPTMTNIQDDVCMIGDFTCYTVNDATIANDLRTHDFRLIDNLGAFSFADLRLSLLHYYDGNRGEDWADYRATKNVKVNNNFLLFDGHENFKMRSHDGAFSFFGNNHDLMSVRQNETLADVFACSQISVIDTRAVGDSFEFDVAFIGTDFEGGVEKIDWEQVQVLYTESLDPRDVNWVAIDYTHGERKQGVDGAWCYPFTVSRFSRDKGFYKVNASNVTSGAFTMSFNCDVQFNARVFLKGEDGKRYQLKINAGALYLEDDEENVTPAIDMDYIISQLPRYTGEVVQ